MFRTICYFNSFFPAAYFLLFLQNTTDYTLVAGFIVLIVFSGLLLRQLEAAEFRTNTILTIVAILIAVFFVKEVLGLFNLLKVLDLEYLSYDTVSYTLSTVVLCLTMGIQFVLFLRKIYPKRGIDSGKTNL